jgi:hypothetical protein
MAKRYYNINFTPIVGAYKVLAFLEGYLAEFEVARLYTIFFLFPLINDNSLLEHFASKSKIKNIRNLLTDYTKKSQEEKEIFFAIYRNQYVAFMGLCFDSIYVLENMGYVTITDQGIMLKKYLPQSITDINREKFNQIKNIGVLAQGTSIAEICELFKMGEKYEDREDNFMVQ